VRQESLQHVFQVKARIVSVQPRRVHQAVDGRFELDAVATCPGVREFETTSLVGCNTVLQ
jgi:hypothetical protein